MKRGVWVAALALCVGGIGQLPGQETAWRPVSRPAPAVARAASLGAPSAALGRPFTVVRSEYKQGPEPPRPFPPAYRLAPPTPPQFTAGVEPIATVPPPGAVIAASAPSAVPWTGTREEVQHDAFGGELFANDRIALPAPGPALLPVSSEPSKLGNWQGTFPVTAPAAEAAPAPQPSVFGDSLPPTKWYARGEYLLWWTKDDTTPPLVTTGQIVPGRANETLAGTIGQPDTQVLFGGTLRRDPYSGGRFTFGYYIDDCGEKAIEASGFFLGRQSNNFSTDTLSNAIITRPFFDVNNGVESVQQVSFPGRAIGRVTVNTPSQLWGAEMNLICQWCCGCDWRIDPLVGVRYLNLSESIDISEFVLIDPNLRRTNADGTDAGPDPLAGATFTVQDRFSTRNNFFGGQVGLEGRWQRDRLTVDGRAKLGIGVTQQSLRIDGSQDVLFPDGRRMSFVGGLLALNGNGGNIGSFERSGFSVVPELTFTVGYYLTDRLRATAGYNFLYWTNVLRPGDQIDRGLDVNRIPNFVDPPMAPVFARPAVPFATSDFWAHGLTFGLEYRY